LRLHRAIGAAHLDSILKFVGQMLSKIFSRKGAKTQSLRIKPMPKKIPLLPWRPFDVAQDMLCAFARVISFSDLPFIAIFQVCLAGFYRA